MIPFKLKPEFGLNKRHVTDRNLAQLPKDYNRANEKLLHITAFLLMCCSCKDHCNYINHLQHTV